MINKWSDCIVSTNGRLLISKSLMFHNKSTIPGCIHSLAKEVFQHFRLPFLILTCSGVLCCCHVCQLPLMRFVCGLSEQMHRCRCTAQYSRSRPRNSLGMLPGWWTSPHPSCDRTSEGTKPCSPHPVNYRPGTWGPYADKHDTDTDLSTRQECDVWTRALFVIVVL